jgi:anti-anti-sigma factor
MPDGEDGFDVAPAALAPGELRIRGVPTDGTLLVAVAGELDLATAHELQAQVDQLATEAKELVLDLRGVAFIDSTGLRALLESKAVCEWHGCGFSISHGQPAVERLFEVSGLAGSLPFRNVPWPEPNGQAGEPGA